MNEIQKLKAKIAELDDKADRLVRREELMAEVYKLRDSGDAAGSIRLYNEVFEADCADPDRKAEREADMREDMARVGKLIKRRNPHFQREPKEPV